MKIFQIAVMILCGLFVANAIAAETKKDPEAKELSGISIIGNKEAPKSPCISCHGKIPRWGSNQV